MQKRGLFKIIALVFLVSGCGYTTRSQVMDKYKTIYVRQFQNKIDITSESSAARMLKTNFPAIETEITKAVIDRFIWDGDLRPSREEDADLILKGEVTEFRRDALRYIQDTEDIEEYRITLVVNLKLIDKKDNKVLWQQDNLAGDTSFFTQGKLVQSEDSAVQNAVADLSRRIVERVVENW
ncbi:MAG: LPS assembly lipoprotein LptE [Candidatus Omnitrophica bacterium]|nr:LPS assembly lipoprotein LptE [Candidatus Omnitrophota bacterium]MDD5610799.1 LPS assembly lipoprotein LptE [Candidatus Omnitrophota bacterium]